MSKKTKKIPEKVTANINLSFFGKPVQVQASVPTGKMRPKRMLPVFHNLTASFMKMVVKNIEAQGAQISCTKGCAACCRQLIPLSEIEVYKIYDLVSAMPEPRKSIVIARFAEAKKRMDEAGLLDSLQNPQQVSNDEFKDLGLRYFDEKVACPFLENEACSIYNDRPTVCRQYMVISPAENCKRLNGEPVQVLKTAFDVSEAIKCFNDPQYKTVRFIPLIMALEWSATHPDTSVERPGTEIFGQLLNNLIGKPTSPKST